MSDGNTKGRLRKTVIAAFALVVLGFVAMAMLYVMGCAYMPTGCH